MELGILNQPNVHITPFTERLAWTKTSVKTMAGTPIAILILFSPPKGLESLVLLRLYSLVAVIFL
jgi:hypothetical protein